MVLKLIEPAKEYLPSVYEAVKEFEANPSEYDVGPIKKIVEAAKDGFKSYFKEVKDESLGINLKPNHVASSTYWLVDGNQYIGGFDLRHALTPNLERIGGHIAYEIRPSMRRKGFAFEGLKLCLEKAADMGIEKVLITCNSKNEASYGVILKAMFAYGGEEIPMIACEKGMERRVWVWCQKHTV